MDRFFVSAERTGWYRKAFGKLLSTSGEKLNLLSHSSSTICSRFPEVSRKVPSVRFGHNDGGGCSQVPSRRHAWLPSLKRKRLLCMAVVRKRTKGGVLVRGGGTKFRMARTPSDDGDAFCAA